MTERPHTVRVIKPELNYYFLITGEIVFHLKDDDSRYSARLNTVVQSSDGRFPVALIGKAQQALQMQFFKNMDDPTVTVVDVVILGLTNLGQFTEVEFHAKPESMALQPKGPIGNA